MSALNSNHRSDKRARGEYYTLQNPFQTSAFTKWSNDADIANQTILEPFAGSNALISMLSDMSLCSSFRSYDIAPSSLAVGYRDTLTDFPTGLSVCVTNPPWIAKNSATRRGLDYPAVKYDNLYKYALELCLDNCDWVAALVPESFIRASLFQSRLTDFISITGKLFRDTDQPVGLALFSPKPTRDTLVWRDESKVGNLSKLLRDRPTANKNVPCRFNSPKGNVGLIAVDDTRTASIRFCEPIELEHYKVKPSSRSLTKILVEGPVKLDLWNEFLSEFRRRNQDVLLTSFKGMRQDGRYRRRLDFALARAIICHV